MDRGEIVELGNHRLMCGDATKRDDVMKLINGQNIDLVLTDPPYGINLYNSGGHYKGKGKRKFLKVYQNFIGDNNDEAARLHYEIVKDKKSIFWGGQFFCFLPISHGWLIWDKQTNIKNYSDCEMAWTSFLGHNKIYVHRWCGFMKAGSRKLNPIPRVHPTQKPVELHMKMIEDFTMPDNVVLDCFGGSGTTLIACEMTARKCLMMEISPEYCEIIINRWRNLCG